MGRPGRDTRRKTRRAKKEKSQCEYRKHKFTDLEILAPLCTFFGVSIINFALWIVLSPINQSEVALYATSKFFALVVTIIEAAILLYLVATNERGSATRLIIGTLIIASLLMSFFRFTNEKITEEGYSFISPIRSYTLLWEDMVFYESYDADSNAVALPFLKGQGGLKETWAGFSTTAYSSWSNDEYPRRVGWDLIEFRTITDAAKQKYGSREEFLDDTFINRYGHLEAEWSKEDRAYVLKTGEIVW